MPVIVKELQGAGLAKHDAWEIWEQGFTCVDPDKRPEQGADGAFEHYIREKIHLLKRQAPSKIKNKVGFLISAIKRNYANPYFAEMRYSKLDGQEGRTAYLRVPQRQQAEHEKERLEREHCERIHQICTQLLDETPPLMEQIIIQLLAEEPSYRQFYESDKTPTQNYHEHAFLAAAVEMQLMQRYPKRFESIRAAYDKQMAKLNRQLEAPAE
jgi:hypothetical protein